MITATISYAPPRSALRRDGAALLSQHYTGTSGNAGRMYVLHTDATISGVCMIGESCSQRATRSIVAAPWPVAVIKRLYCRDEAPAPESQLLRAAMRLETAYRQQTTLFVSYADPAATDARTGLPLTGAVYLASGMFYIGETFGRRMAFLDAEGRVRSSRQGSRTLTRATAPTTWQAVTLPPCRIWATVVAPPMVGEQPTSTRWQRQQRRRCWAALDPRRRVYATRWIERRELRRWTTSRRVRITDQPDRLRWPNQRQPGAWEGRDLVRTAAPIWVPLNGIQIGMVIDECTAGRRYAVSH